MKSTTVPSSWMAFNKFRLDSTSYLSGSIEQMMHLNKLSIRKYPLQSLTLNGTEGLIEIGRIKPIWVDEPSYGIPFISNTNILQADLSNIAFISKRTVQSHPELLVQEGWLLIPCTGPVGNVVYCRSDMSGMACSENILRVVPDPNKIPPGYLYTYLSSKFGIVLIASFAYGATVRHIAAQHIAHLPIPRLGEIEKVSHDLCIKAATLRTQANLKLKRAGDLLNKHFRFPKILPLSHRHGDLSITATSSLQLQSRMDATFHDMIASEGDRLIQSLGKTESLSDLVDINTTEKLKRVFVSQEYGVPFFTQAEVGRLRYSPTRFLSRHLLPQDESWAIHEGDLLLAQNSPINKSAGLGMWADKRFQGSCSSTDILRLRSDDRKISSGYIYAYLFLTDIGYRQIVRTMVGSTKPRLSVRDILALRIPRTTRDIESEIGELVREAGNLRAKAQEKEDTACKIVEQALQNIS